MADERARRSAVIDYWRAVERFSPQKIPALAPRDRVFPVEPGSPLPWEADHPLRAVPLEEGQVWQHVVYGGAFPLTAVRDTLLSVFGGTEEDHDGRLEGESALFALTVTDEGRPVRDAAVLSSCAWATGRALGAGPGHPGRLDGFEEEHRAWTARVTAPGGTPDPHPPAPGPAEPDTTDPHAGPPEEGPATEPGGPTALTAERLLGLVADLAEDWGLTEALAPHGVRVRSTAVRADRADRADDPTGTGPDFLNSFVATDLERVAAALADTAPGPGLAAYLTPGSAFGPEGRTDVRRRPRTVLDGVAPDRTPAGRWPAPEGEPLALSQQFAVNALRESLTGDQERPGAGLFAVNGPPGTGKTTMLRDCFAAVVVDRARLLAGLRLPSAAFADQPPHVWRTGEYTRTVTALRPEFTGFEMVVASTGNGAVENVSTGIPARSSLGPEWEAADYYAEQATRLLKGDPAWGAFAARLGSRRNRIDFVNRFWHGRYRRTDGGAAPLPLPLQTPRRGTGSARDRDWRELRDRTAWLESGNGLAHLLRQWRDTSQSGVWREARERFHTAWEDVERLRAERAAAAEALAGREDSLAAVRTTTEAVAAAARRLDAARRDLAEAEDALPPVRETLTAAEEEHTAHLARRPGFTVSLFTLGRAARDWHGDEAELADRTAAALRAAEVEARTAAGAEERRAAEVTAARARWGEHVPEEAWYTGAGDGTDAAAGEADRERSAPWADPELNRARSALFLAALDLHQAFLRCTARTMYQNLMAAMDAVAGSVPAGVPEEHLRAAWQSLFLVVPVVSTTFASLDRVFGGLGRHSLGWLFVDEGGQAAPQLAVGGIWRARRTVVVGDPLQLEPVVVLPWTAQRALREEYGAGSEWVPGATSVQRLADRGNRYGTLLPAPGPEGPAEVWVGAPLRVHRRCDEPMFGLSNRIAYDGLMVRGTPERGEYRHHPASSWVDVVSSDAEGHWIPEEGRALRRVLERLRDEGGVDLAREVFVISPFRAVVEGAMRHCRDLMPADRVGTVHTTQGKEADVVVLVLGTDPRVPAARAWAAARPNLLNVAVSRARRRLFVIGNLESWRGHRHFADLAEALPAHTWQLQSRGRGRETG
ncbi:DEAD/DEAH box helicase [Streptomyces sp. NPDC097619]|uniref:DEAD/DEAH box helicase n=1 Tax=Streptomyces sp. NPDC097619 TaxID=3157228 RepID=UPI00333076D2